MIFCMHLYTKKMKKLRKLNFCFQILKDDFNYIKAGKR